MKGATVVVAGLVCGLALVASPSTSQRVGTVPTAQAVEVPPRIAFTDDRDQVEQVRLDRTLTPVDEPSPPSPPPSSEVPDPVPVPGPVPVPAPGARLNAEASAALAAASEESVIALGETRVSATAADHSGEASGHDAPDFALVSTSGDDLDGEVWIGEANTANDGSRGRVTCNDAVESHPVVNVRQASGDDAVSLLEYRVAFASDLDGDWDVYVASAVVEEPGEGESLFDALPDDCDGWTVQNITGDGPDALEDLWPSWMPDGGGIAFSRSGPANEEADSPDPLGDIYLYELDCECRDPLTPLVRDPGSADTQPSVTTITPNEDTEDPDELWLAYTSTGSDPRGSVALLDLAARNPYGTVEVLPSGSSEASWGGTPSSPYIAYTSTSVDPYGDVEIAHLSQPTPPSEGDLTPPSILFTTPVANEPGRAESHGTWLTSFEDGAEDSTAQFVFTARALDADISDVEASTGAGRRTLEGRSAPDPDGAIPLDEAGPSYSPDGDHIVYSEGIPGQYRGRQLVIANADGSNPQFLQAGREDDDVDKDPAWSPDGQHIAFTRYLENGDGWDDPEAWVVDVASDLADSNPRSVTRTPPDSELTYVDLYPSWSPDSKRLVVSRAVEGAAQTCDSAVLPPVARAQPVNVELGREDLTTTLWIIEAVVEGPVVEGPVVEGPVVEDPVLEDPVIGRGAEINRREAGQSYQLRLRTPRAPQPGCDDGEMISDVPGRTPAWSPDGHQIAYSSFGAIQTVELDAGPTGNVWEVASPDSVTGFKGQFQGGAPTPSRSVISAADDPTWAPDGSEIAFSGQPAGQPDQRGIWAIAPEGTGLRLVTNLDPDQPTPLRDERGPDTEPSRQPIPVPPPPVKESADIAVTVTLDGPATMYVGPQSTATFTVTNSLPNAAAGVVLTATYPENGLVPVSGEACLVASTPCALGTLAPGASLSFPVVLAQTAETTGEVRGTVTTTTVDPDLTNNEAAVPVTVVQPTIRLLPAVARPGMVVLAYGENMPPRTQVLLQWDRGITADPGPYTVGKDGKMRAGMLIVRRDLLGDRVLLARSVPKLFSPLEGPLLVVARVFTPSFRTRG